MQAQDGAEYVASLQLLASQYERNMLSVAVGLTEHSTKKKIDKDECDNLDRAIKKTVSRWRRTTSLAAELFTEVSIEQANRESEIAQMRARERVNAGMLTRAQAENDSIRALIAKLNALS
jgi:hypothetical protein